MLIVPPEGQNVQSVASVSIRGIVKNLYGLAMSLWVRFSYVVQMAVLRSDNGRGNSRIYAFLACDTFLDGVIPNQSRHSRR